MEAKDLIYTRRSIRAYKTTPVPKDCLDRVFSAALMAPSWKNTQTAGYMAVTSPEMKEKVLSCLPAFNANTAKDAPVIVVMTANRFRSGYERDGSYSTKKEDRWESFDAGIACQTLCLAAWNEGLGTCIMGIFDEDAIASVLNIPENQVITAVIPMGYPAAAPTAPARKSLDEKVHYV